MPRLARTVFAGVPHHVTQRGNRREDIFLNDDHRNQYLEWLTEYCQRYHVEILSYCLMTNHVHLVMVPKTETGLQQVLKPLHMRYGLKKGSVTFYLEECSHLTIKSVCAKRSAHVDGQKAARHIP